MMQGHLPPPYIPFGYIEATYETNHV